MADHPTQQDVMLATTRFKDAPVKLAMHDGAGGARVDTLQNVLAASNQDRVVA